MPVDLNAVLRSVLILLDLEVRISMPPLKTRYLVSDLLSLWFMLNPLLGILSLSRNERWSFINYLKQRRFTGSRDRVRIDLCRVTAIPNGSTRKRIFIGIKI